MRSVGSGGKSGEKFPRQNKGSGWNIEAWRESSGDSSVSVSVSSYTVPATEMEREEGYTEE